MTAPADASPCDDASPGLEACPLCHAAAARSVAAWTGGDGFSWSRCACGLVLRTGVPPGLARDAAPAHYDAAYFERYARRRRRRVAKSRAQVRDALESLGPRVAPAGAALRLLDVGCSLGYALEAAHSLGLEATGVDLADGAVEACRSRGFEARTGSLGQLPFGDSTFHVVILKHVFEHTAQPRRALADLRRVLVPGGVAFLAVPHAGYGPAARNPAAARFYRGEAAAAHPLYYTPATLGRLLGEEGFRVDAVHPRLVHRRAPWPRRAAEAAAWPVMASASALRSALALRKEFWVVAVKE